MATSFEITGIDDLGKKTTALMNKVQKGVDLAARAGVAKAADMVAYGKVNNIKASSVTSTSVVGRAANKLRLPVEHLYYRTFLQGIKVSHGKGRSAKPYASIMMRGNRINVADLLASASEAKGMYGFTSRKRKVVNKKRPDLSSKAASARVGGRRSGKVKIGRITYSNAYVEDGSTRASSEAMNKHYMKKLGASERMLKGKMFLVFKKKSRGQKLPYPAKAMVIKSRLVMKVLEAAANEGISNNWNKIGKIQMAEVQKRLKKIGFKSS